MVPGSEHLSAVVVAAVDAAVVIHVETAASAVVASVLPPTGTQTGADLVQRRRCGGQCSLHLVNIAPKEVLE